MPPTLPTPHNVMYNKHFHVSVRHRFSFSSLKNVGRSDNEQKVQFVGLGNCCTVLFDVFRCVWLSGGGGCPMRKSHL